jgi:hypothetical protein
VLYVAFIVGAGATFGGHFLTVGRVQHASMVDTSSGYWDECFPPSDLRDLPRWLFAAHAGNLLAYPAGGRDGGSTLTLLLCLVGAAALARRRRAVLALLLAPFVLTLAAAALGKYPYGGSARVAQHLAPSVCLLAGAGAASLIRRAAPGATGRRRWTVAAACLLAAFGVAGMFRDVRKPYKTEADERARQFVRAVIRRAGPDEPVVVFAAPPRLYPSFEWYLRLEGRRVVWVDDPARGPATDCFWSVHFHTNRSPSAPAPPVWEGPGGLFVRAGREEWPLAMGPEDDAVRSAEVFRWTRLPASPAGAHDPPEGKRKGARSTLAPSRVEFSRPAPVTAAAPAAGRRRSSSP